MAGIVLLIPTVTLAYQCHERTCHQGTTCDSTTTCETTIGCRTIANASHTEITSCAATADECINWVIDYYGERMTDECCTSDMCNDGTVQSLPQPQTENYCYDVECRSSDSPCLDSLITHVQDNQIYAYCKATNLGCRMSFGYKNGTYIEMTGCSRTECMTGKVGGFTYLCCADNLCNNATTHEQARNEPSHQDLQRVTISNTVDHPGCLREYFGESCDFRCSENCLDVEVVTDTNLCRRDGGACLGGCKAGYYGHTCGEASESADKQQALGMGPALGGGIGALCVTMLVAIFVLYRKRCRINTPANAAIPMGDNSSRIVPMGDNSRQIVPTGSVVLPGVSDEMERSPSAGALSVPSENEETSGYRRVGKILYNPNDELGRGLKSVVYRGKFENRVVAVKRIDCSSNKAAGETMDDIRKVYCREIDIMNKLDQTGHEHIVRYYVSEVTRAYIYLVFELCDGTLKDYVKTPAWQDKLSPTAVTLHMARGLHYLFSLGVAHRDIKPENVLIIVNAPRAVIADFGHSKLTSDDLCSISTGCTSMFGTVGYIAPEAYSAIIKASGEEPVTSMMSSQSDIFSLGCLFYFTLSLGEHPFGVNNLSSQTNIHEHASPTFDKLREWQYTMLKLIAWMIQIKPEDRPSTADVLKHPALWASDKVIRYFSEANACLDEKILQAGYVPDPPNNNWLQNLPNYTLHYLRGYHNGNAYGGRGRNAASHPKAAYHLRAIRNLETHFKDVTFPIDVRNEMGDSNDDHVKFWLTANPTFLMHVYSKMSTCPKLSSYDQI